MVFQKLIKELHAEDNYCTRCNVWYPRSCSDCAVKHVFGLMPHPQHADPSDRSAVPPEKWSALTEFMEGYVPE